MLPSILAKQLEKGIGDYIETTFPMTNDPFKGSIRRMLETGGSVYHEPYVAVRLPFRTAEGWENPFQSIQIPFTPYVHQAMAFERMGGEDKRSTLIATGTGSGKTECFLYPVLEYCYRHRGEPGIKALIIYPMNALASDQAKRIAQTINSSKELHNNVTVGMYVGGHEGNPHRMMGEDHVITDRETMLNEPPDILMTNYKMLDYLLVRPKDAGLWKNNRPDTLKFIAVDEFHTFDGAQGTDLACLLRRLKSRLWIQPGHLCCVGTSATMGSEESSKHILRYASEVFGEPFEEEAIITEDRLLPSEFFAGSEITDFTMPVAGQIAELNLLMEQDDQDAYLRTAAKAWLDDPAIDVLSDTGRIELGKHLMHHSFMQSMISVMKGNYNQVSHVVNELSQFYPALKELGDSEAAVNALLALISHARTGSPGKLRPFLNVQVQLWMRELRRLVARVSPSDITYSIAHDLNEQQARQYLPVVNCRDCGATGWTSFLNEKNNATITALEPFYNRYFQSDKRIMMMFPHDHETIPDGMAPGFLCPNCLQFKEGENGSSGCDNCGTEMIPVVFPNPVETTTSRENKQYICPFCGSRRGLSLMGLRSATEISTELSQLFASKFNDDKKTLAFSDNVQDAAHRAGFFNARTWRFGFRTAVQRYVQNGGAGQSLSEFKKGLIQYWHGQMKDEDYVSYFIAPNMTWMRAYEDMIRTRRFGRDDLSRKLMEDIDKRIAYEVMLEYGVTGRIGRTLEKSGCSCLEFPADVVSKVADHVFERVRNELGALKHTGPESYLQMVGGFLTLMAQNGAFDDPVFYPFLTRNGDTYLLSNDFSSWMPGRQSGRNTPRFIYEPGKTGRRNNSFDSVKDRKYTEWIAACSEEAAENRTLCPEISRIILEELTKDGIVVRITTNPEYTVYALDQKNVFITDQVTQMRCAACGMTHAVAATAAGFWKGAPCMRSKCGGVEEEAKNEELNYYGKLYSRSLSFDASCFARCIATTVFPVPAPPKTRAAPE